MCGIVGVIAFDPRLAITPGVLAAMSHCLAHRGPDGQGEYFSEQKNTPSVALAHRRMAVLDPDPRSNQPFTNGRHWLVFNGEIYNFRQLRQQLSPRDWKTTGDTETLLAAYEQWGENCVDLLNGMFALAIWDAPRQRLFLARDRMGQKPLYIASVPGALAFASEISALLPVPWVDRSIDNHALAEYLRWGYIPTPATIYRGIRQIEPAHALLLTQDNLNSSAYSPIAPAHSTDSAAQRTAHLVRQAVQRQLISDVPLGCFLSGGIDSSVIAAAMVAAVPWGQKVLTFSIGFQDPRYDETQYASAVAAHLGTEHRPFTVRPDAAADLPKIAAAFAQPMADSSALPTYYLAMQTRQHVKVALSGDGGDELFGGYDRYRALRLSRRLAPLEFAKPLIASLPGLHPKSAAARFKRLFSSVGSADGQRYSAYMRLMDEPLLRSLLNNPPDSRTPDFIEAAYNAARQTTGPIQAAMAADRQTYLPDDVLTKVDRCSMLHALEVRSPFLDPDLVSFAIGLPEGQLFPGGTKALLRQAFSADLPAWVFRRKKMGFAVPIGQWLRTSLKSMLRDLLFAPASFASANFRRDRLENMLHEHDTQTADHSQRLYALLMLELWWLTNK